MSTVWLIVIGVVLTALGAWMLMGPVRDIRMGTRNGAWPTVPGRVTSTRIVKGEFVSFRNRYDHEVAGHSHEGSTRPGRTSGFTMTRAALIEVDAVDDVRRDIACLQRLLPHLMVRDIRCGAVPFVNGVQYPRDGLPAVRAVVAGGSVDAGEPRQTAITRTPVSDLAHHHHLAGTFLEPFWPNAKGTMSTARRRGMDFRRLRCIPTVRC
jgi:hypothetical protein